MVKIFKDLGMIMLLILFLSIGIYTLKNVTAKGSPIEITTKYVYEVDYISASNLDNQKELMTRRGDDNWELVHVAGTQYNVLLYWKKTVVKIK